MPDGCHEATVRAVDRAGNVRIRSPAFSVDTNPWSPTGPYGPYPLMGIIASSVAGAFVVAWVLLRRRRKPSG